MNLQISETIRARNPDAVLRTLEECLRSISLEVARDGDQLVASGIGPSYRTKNRNDKTTLRVISERDAIVVHAEAFFQASALMGDQPQDEVVRSKFDRVFECVKANLLASPPAVDPSPILPAEVPPTEPAPKLEIAAEPLPPADHTNPFGTDDTPDLQQIIPLSAASAPPSTAPPTEFEHPETITESTTVEPRSTLEEPANERASTTPPRSARGSRIAFASVLTFCVLLAPALIRRYVPSFSRSSAAPVAATQDNSIPTPPAAIDRTPPISAAPAQEPAPAAPLSTAPNSSETPAPTLPTDTPPIETQAQPSSIRQRVEDWGTALRSRDAFAQTSFYSIRVHPYFENQDVGLDFVLHDKQAEIQKRQGLWTVKLENIVIEQETPLTARVRLVKHYIDEPPQGAVIERFVPSLLHFKRVGGQWYITAEHNLP